MFYTRYPVSCPECTERLAFVKKVLCKISNIGYGNNVNSCILHASKGSDN